MFYRNVHRFSRDVPETAHDGHEVEHIRDLTAQEADPEVGQMSEVRCVVDGAVFDVFPEELDESDNR